MAPRRRKPSVVGFGALALPQDCQSAKRRITYSPDEDVYQGRETYALALCEIGSSDMSPTIEQPVFRGSQLASRGRHQCHHDEVFLTFGAQTVCPPSNVGHRALLRSRIVTILLKQTLGTHRG